MPPKSPSRIGPIKLKLSIASKPIVSTSPPFSTQTSMTRKGKEKAAKDDDEKLLVPKVELDDLEIESRALGRSSKQVILRTPELKQPYHESDTYSSVALPANGDRASLERSSRRGSSLDESSGSTTPAPCQHTVPPSPAPEPARHLAVSTTPQSAQDTPRKTVVKIPRTSGRTKGKRKKTATRPSAIPPRMLSANPSTPRLTPLPRLPTSTPATPEVHTVKLEPEMTEHAEADLVPLPLAPDVVQMSTPKEECDEVVTTGTETAKKGTKWGRLRKPLKEVFGKLIGELRRKDEVS